MRNASIGTGCGAIASFDHPKEKKVVCTQEARSQGNVHPDQFWQDVVLGNVKRMAFSRIWEGGNELSAPVLDEIRSIGTLSVDERRERMHGRCASCQWFNICGGGFRTRAAFANHDLWGSDPGCYLSNEEIGTDLAVC